MSSRRHRILRHPEISKLLELRATILVDNYFDYLASLPVKMFGKGTIGLPPYRTLLMNEAFARRAGAPTIVTHQSERTEDGKTIRRKERRDAFAQLQQRIEQIRGAVFAMPPGEEWKRRFREYVDLSRHGGEEITRKIHEYVFQNARQFEQENMARELHRWDKRYPKLPLSEVIDKAQEGNDKYLCELVKWDPHWLYIDWVKRRVLNFFFVGGAKQDKKQGAWVFELLRQPLRNLGVALQAAPARFPRWRRSTEDENRLALIVKHFVTARLRGEHQGMRSRRVLRTFVKQLGKRGAFEYGTDDPAISDDTYVLKSIQRMGLVD